MEMIADILLIAGALALSSTAIAVGNSLRCRCWISQRAMSA